MQDLIDILRQEHHRFYVTEGFRWVSDQERLGQLEAWRLLIDPVTHERIDMEGDCEDCALTEMERCLRRGIPRNQIGILRVATEVCFEYRAFDHAVCGLLNTKGEVVYFSDNRYQHYGLVKPSDTRYRFYDLVTPDSLRDFKAAKLFTNKRRA